MSVFTLFNVKISSLFILSGVLVLSGCNANSISDNQNFGLASGTAVGGAAPTSTSTANKQPPSEAMVALAGGVIGKASDIKLNDTEHQLALEAELDALEYSPAGQSVKWGKSVSGNSGIVTASKTYGVGTSNCRQYVHRVKFNGKTETARGTACKEQDGNWVPLT